MADSPKSHVPSIPQDLLFLAPLLNQSQSSTPSPQCSGDTAQGNPSDFVPPPESFWSACVGNSLDTLSQIAYPVFSEDGIPTVQAPQSIVLGSAQIWKNHLVAHFHESLWSFEGFSIIASSVGKPLHPDFVKLPPYSVGVVRIKV